MIARAIWCWSRRMAPTMPPDVSGRQGLPRSRHDVGVNYRADTWHHPLTALDWPARFVVLTFVDGTETDEQFVTLPEPVTIEA